MRRWLCLIALVAAPAWAGEPTARGIPLAITATPVTVQAAGLDGLTQLGAWELAAPSPAFGGLSGLLVAGGRLTAVTDQAHWLTADLGIEGTALTLQDARIAPILGRARVILDKSGGDAESLTRRDDDLLVGFEHDHRIAKHLGDGHIGGDLRPRAFAALAPNAGIEALATLTGDRLLALAEGDSDHPTAMFLIDRGGRVTTGSLPRTSPHLVTGADVGPDGRLYLTWRDYTPLVGLDIEIRRYDLGPDGFPVAESAKRLAHFAPSSRIDNVEGIALDGSRLWIVSDDNFNALQRTLLLAFEVTP